MSELKFGHNNKLENYFTERYYTSLGRCYKLLERQWLYDLVWLYSFRTTLIERIKTQGYYYFTSLNKDIISLQFFVKITKQIEKSDNFNVNDFKFVIVMYRQSERS